MDIISDIPELRKRLSNAGRIAFVPTMGNLHDGHLALIQLARQHCDFVVASIFVNPLQFGANEDFTKYPRTLAEDISKLENINTDVLFTPSDACLYPAQQTVLIELPTIANELCGAQRPGHFRAVATIVLKLLNIVQPHTAVFGKKDFQQLYVIRTMVQQLNLPVEIISGNTVREQDGLAMSSRNGYLDLAQRQEAPRLYRALQQVAQAVQSGKHDLSAIETQTREYMTLMGWVVDYIEIRNAETLAKPAESDLNLVTLGAARLGKTRLIDNIEFCAH